MIKVCPSEEAVAQEAAKIFIERFQKSVRKAGRFSVVLSGGNTPVRTYSLLASEPFKSQIDWSLVDVFWGDERCVKASDSRSNYGGAYRGFLSQVPIPFERIHPIICFQDPKKSAIEYEEVLKQYFAHSLARFDLVILGLGTNGHTASLFPGSSALEEKEHWVAPLKNENEDFSRITLTPQILNLAETILFMVTGQDKAQVLKEVLAKGTPSHSLPARLINPVDGQLIWLADARAYPTPSGELQINDR